MWSNAPAVLLVTLCCSLAPVRPEEMGDQASICAMTDVLVAMKHLMEMLAGEIRDLKEQVKNSCQAPIPAANTTCLMPQESELEPTPTKSTGSSTPTTTESTIEDDDDDDFDDPFTLEVEKEEKEYNLEDAEENPVSEVLTGLTNWWETFAPFAPKPDTTTSQPDDDDKKTGTDGDDEDDVEVGEADTDTDTDEAAQTPRPRTTTTTTTTTTPRPYTLPPVPRSCPSPFRLEAMGCYLIVQDTREWRSWGEAHAFCQSYGGRLAAPWRLPELQSFLSHHYSDAFWVGARYVRNENQWKWLTGRSVEQQEWRQGQPHRHPGKQCVYLDKWSSYHANNFFCGEKYPFVCESNEQY